jgi:hypothetical protein
VGVGDRVGDDGDGEQVGDVAVAAVPLRAEGLGAGAVREASLPQHADPVRLNIELFVALRSKVEHRYERNLKIVTGGWAHAHVINYEQEVVDHFGA